MPIFERIIIRKMWTNDTDYEIEELRKRLYDDYKNDKRDIIIDYNEHKMVFHVYEIRQIGNAEALREDITEIITVLLSFDYDNEIISGKMVSLELARKHIDMLIKKYEGVE